MDASPQLFRHLQLADDGGLKEEVGCLYHHGRLIGSVVTLVVVCMNITCLIRVDLHILRQKNEIGAVDRLNLTEILIKAVGWQRHFYMAEQLVAHFELLVLFVLVAMGVFYALSGIYERRRFQRWLSAARLFREVIPELQHFSAMRALQHVQPYVARREFKRLLADVKDRRDQGERTSRLWLEVVVFFATRVLIFIFGFDAFIVKFRVAADCASCVGFSPFLRIVLFLNQMLGVVSLERFTMRRLYQFVFGGEDNTISAGEERLLTAWTAKLYERIWTVPTTTPVRALAVSVTFNDEDFQRLMLNETEIEVPTPPANLVHSLSESDLQKDGGRVHRLKSLFQRMGLNDQGQLPPVPEDWQQEDDSARGSLPSRAVARRVTAPVLGASRRHSALPAPVPRMVDLSGLE